MAGHENVCLVRKVGHMPKVVVITSQVDFSLKLIQNGLN